MQKLERFADWLSAIAMWIAIIVGTLMMLHVTADALARWFSITLFGTIEIDRGRIRFGHVDVETGRPWSPPS